LNGYLETESIFFGFFVNASAETDCHDSLLANLYLKVLLLDILNALILATGVTEKFHSKKKIKKEKFDIKPNSQVYAIYQENIVF
jgi:hypothetical protein